MKTFKEYLVEENLTDKEVRELIKKYRNGELDYKYKNTFPQCSVRNGKIYTKKIVNITPEMYINNRKKLALPFAEVGGLIITSSNTTFENFPYKVDGDVKCKYINRWIKSLEGFPSQIDGNVEISLMPNLSFAKVNDHITYLNGYIEINAGYIGPLLGFLKIKGLTGISYDYMHSKYQSYMDAEKNSLCVKALKIINKHLKSGRDIVACAEELIETGLKEYAKL